MMTTQAIIVPGNNKTMPLCGACFANVFQSLQRFLVSATAPLRIGCVTAQVVLANNQIGTNRDGMSSSRISQLAFIIAEKTAAVDGYFASKNLPRPSFEVSGPAKVPIPDDEIQILAAQDAVIASTQELHDLMKGPSEMLMSLSVVNPNDVLSLQAVYHYKVASSFPIHSTATYSEISSTCGLNEVDLRRLLRHAMTNHIFEERDGRVAHTAASRILAENSMTRDIVGIMCEEMFPGTPHTINALEKYNPARAPNESGFSLGQRTDKGLYEELGEHPERGQRFANAMEGFAGRTSVETLANGFDWASVNTVVDVGGGWGAVSIDLAQRFPHLRFTVQDLEHVIADRPKLENDSESNKVQFQAHDFFATQILDSDVYYFRYIYHNLPDESCVKLLRAQIPALKYGAHVIIQDAVIPEPRDVLPSHKEKWRRSMDLVMLTFFGARERTFREWKDIIRTADERFEVEYKHVESGQPSDILDVVWKGHA